MVVETRVTIHITPIVLDRSLTTAEFGEVAVPAYHAFIDSPHWRPVLTGDGVIYIWRDGEGVYDPRSRWLYYVTRSSRKIVVVQDVRGIPGGRLGNVMREPDYEMLQYGFMRRDVATAMFLFKNVLHGVRFGGVVVSSSIEEGQAAVFKIKTEKTAGEILATAYRLYRWYPVFVLYIRYELPKEEKKEKEEKKWRKFIEAVKSALPQYLQKTLDEQLKTLDSQS